MRIHGAPDSDPFIGPFFGLRVFLLVERFDEIDRRAQRPIR